MDVATRTIVRRRAANCCEYCRLSQLHSPLLQLQIEHVIPRKHGGSDDPANLALACSKCNLHKGTNLTGIDPESRQVTRLFNPRHDRWEDHFAWDGPRIVGLTAIGRTTVQVLNFNSLARIRIRRAASGG
jgi:5-methylcytosine-specific restriction endonuclease McrA